MLHENLVTPQFATEVKAMSDRLGFIPDWLMAVMYNESRFNHRITNSIGCVGLIQFCPVTQRALDVTADTLRSITAVQQLLYVEMFYKKDAHRIRQFSDLYLLTFYPVVLWESKPDSFEFPSNVVRANPTFDLNKDGRLTVGEFRAYCDMMLPPELRGKTITPKRYKGIGIGLIALSLLMLLFWYDHYYGQRKIYNGFRSLWGEKVSWAF